MEVHERFYGMAMDEIKGGADRRHDLWAKAIALSKGEVEKTEAIYMDLLARFFSETATKADREELKQTAVSLAAFAGTQGKRISFNILCLAVWGALSFMIYLGGTNWADKLYSQYVFERTVIAEPGQGDHIQQKAVDLKGNEFTEPSEKEYYQAYVSRMTGIPFKNLPKAAIDSAEAKTWDYGVDAAAMLARGGMRAQALYSALSGLENPDYSAAIKAHFWQWLLLAVVCLGAGYVITWSALKAYRQGRFETPHWLK